MKPKSHVLEAIRTYYPDYHPLVSIAHLAHDQMSDPRLKFDCHRVIAKYVEPELKSLEVKGTFSETRRVSVSLFDDTFHDDQVDVVDAVMVEPVTVSSKINSIIDAY